MRVDFKLFRSFRSRILALVLGLVTTVLTATLFAVMWHARTAVQPQVASQLRSAADTANEMLQFRADQLTSAIEVLTSDFGFKEAVALGNIPTLLSAIENQRARIRADAIIVMDEHGGLVASTLGNVSAATRSDLHDLVSATTSEAELQSLFRSIDGRPYQVVLAPMTAPLQIGWTIATFALNGRALLSRRFWHGPLLTGPFEAFACQRDKDRPILHPGARASTGR